MLLYLSDRFADHETGDHPECPARIRRVNELLRELGWLEKATVPQWQPAEREQILRVHGATYVDQLANWCQQNAGYVESDTTVCSASWDASHLAAGAAVDAVQRILNGEHQKAFCAIRPPGHHALPSRPMGFCLLNNVAVAAREALAAGLRSVLIVDWDVHHGNGTQDIFYDEDRVGLFSIHRYPFYPGTGAADETGTGKGLGWTINAPVPGTIDTPEYFDRFTDSLEQLAARIQPELVLISAGFDAHRDDPVGSLCLVKEDFAELTKLVNQLASSYCDGKVVSLLEGGYHLDHLPTSVLAHVQALAEGEN